MQEPSQIELPRPEIKLIWDTELQDVSFQFETKDFKNWDFLILVLGMAIRKAEGQLRAQQMIAQMQAMQRAKQEAELRKILR